MTITLFIILVTGLISYMAFQNEELMEKLLHRPYVESKNQQMYRWLTAGFLHADWTHLLINLYVLYSFGAYVENWYKYEFGIMKGGILYGLLYILSMVLANLVTFQKHKQNSGFASVGASGAIAGILFAFILFEPWNMLLLFFIIPIPAFLFAILYVLYSHYASRHSYHERIDHDAHLYGALTGMAFTILLKPALVQEFLQKIVRDAPF